MLMEQPKAIHKGSLHHVPTAQSVVCDSATQGGHPCSTRVLATAKSPRRKRYIFQLFEIYNYI